MKSSPRLLFYTVVAALLLGFLFWYSRGKKPLEVAPNEGRQTSQVPSGTGIQKSEGDTPQLAEKAPVVQDERKRYEEKLSAALESKNVAAEFWGKVVDQEARPLSGVKITSSLRHWQAISAFVPETQFIKSETQTGPDGMFYIGGQTGDTISIETMEKVGYELEPNAKRSFGYNTSEQFRSNPDSPVLFRMWQTNIHEELVTGQKSFHLETDGRPYLINFRKGTIAESIEGDLKVSIKYETEVTRGQIYDWSAEVAVMNGGLLEETDPNSSMYMAPTSGYTPTFRYEQQIKGGQRGSTGIKRFFFRLNSGQEYGRITVEMFAPYNDRIPGLVRIQYTLNPSGSRILR